MPDQDPKMDAIAKASPAAAQQSAQIQTDQVAQALEADLKEAARIKSEMDKLTPLKREYDEVRQRIDFAMHAMKSQRTAPVAGYFAVLQQKTSVQITDDAKVIKWLEDNTFDPTEYMRLDADMIKALQQHKMQEDGEYIPGVETIVTEAVTLRKETKK